MNVYMPNTSPFIASYKLFYVEWCQYSYAFMYVGIFSTVIIPLIKHNGNGANNNPRWMVEMESLVLLI